MLRWVAYFCKLAVLILDVKSLLTLFLSPLKVSLTEGGQSFFRMFCTINIKTSFFLLFQPKLLFENWKFKGKVYLCLNSTRVSLFLLPAYSSPSSLTSRSVLTSASPCSFLMSGFSSSPDRKSESASWLFSCLTGVAAALFEFSLKEKK